MNSGSWTREILEILDEQFLARFPGKPHAYEDTVFGLKFRQEREFGIRHQVAVYREVLTGQDEVYQLALIDVVMWKGLFSIGGSSCLKTVSHDFETGRSGVPYLLPVEMRMVTGKDCGNLVVTPDGKGDITPTSKGNAEFGMEPCPADIFSPLGLYKVILSHFMELAKQIDILFGFFLLEPVNGSLSVKCRRLSGVKPSPLRKKRQCGLRIGI